MHGAVYMSVNFTVYTKYCFVQYSLHCEVYRTVHYSTVCSLPLYCLDCIISESEETAVSHVSAASQLFSKYTHIKRYWYLQVRI